jgi:hypothetical protein
MRPDQIQRINDLTERLADVFLMEADPSNWTADGIVPCDMEAQQRGDRHWCKKGAISTGAVLKHALDIARHYTESNRQPAPGQPDPLDESIAGAERRAAKAVKDALNKAAGKKNFDKRVHGR